MGNTSSVDFKIEFFGIKFEINFKSENAKIS
jgi:hypothetical protein